MAHMQSHIAHMCRLTTITAGHSHFFPTILAAKCDTQDSLSLAAKNKHILYFAALAQ